MCPNVLLPMSPVYTPCRLGRDIHITHGPDVSYCMALASRLINCDLNDNPEEWCQFPD